MKKHQPQDTAELQASRDKGHEIRDVPPRLAWLAGIGLAVLLGVSMLAMWGLWSWIAAPGAGPSEAAGGDGREMLAIRLEMEEEQRETIDGYGWINEQQKLARIPVGRAMELIAADPSLLEGTPAEEAAEEQPVPEETDDAPAEANDAPANESDNEPEGGDDE